MELPNPIQWAIPFFIALIILELTLWKLRRRARYETRDMAASLSMGLGNLISGALTGGVIFALQLWVHQYRVFDIGYSWWAFVLAFLVQDLAFYIGHRLSHEHRWFWANHVTHHSSQHYNLSTALRQPWLGLFTGLFVLSLPPVLLGIPPALYAFVGGVNLIYQFWIHTEVIDRMGPLEWVLNTPSHHRVHHAVNPEYLDSNYGGMLIIWDRLFGTFVAEQRAEQPRYGLVKNIRTFNPLKIVSHEYLSIFRDLASARSLSEVKGYLFGPPGWSPDGSRQTSADIKAAWKRWQAGADGIGAGCKIPNDAAQRGA